MLMPTAFDQPAIVEADEERDRKTCVSLDMKVTGANRELAQWLLHHPGYTLQTIADWLNCGPTRIWELRNWARNGFVGSISNRAKRRDFRRAENPPLETNENSEPSDNTEYDSEMVEDPAIVCKNLLDTVSRSCAVVHAYKKILKVSPLDEEAKKEASYAIGKLVSKWQSLQRAIAPRRTQ